jgi:hypothetical protein
MVARDSHLVTGETFPLLPAFHPWFSGVFAAIPEHAVHALARENSHDFPAF